MSLPSAARLRRLPLSRGDVLLGVVVAIPILGSLIYRARQEDQPLIALLALGAVFPLVLRRREPLLALALAIVLRATIPDNQALLLPALVVLYTIATRRSWPPAAAGAFAVALASLLAGALWGNVSEHSGLLGYAIGTTASCAAAVAVGLYVGARSRVIEGLHERAERLDRERELLADRAVAQERVRIAQELHDVIAHNISLIVVTAQGLGATVPDSRVTEGTEAIAELGRQAMTEMHRTLRLLRAGAEDSASLAPQPALANLDRLLEQARTAGLDVKLAVAGQPRPLPQSEDLSAYRIIQEALTNVIRHAPGARTTVSLDYQPTALRLTVIDSGELERDTARAPHVDGHGLVGMRERAALFGGTLTAAPQAGRGFEVTAVLPYDEIR
jgi:signal transduction histidine kinase